MKDRPGSRPVTADGDEVDSVASRGDGARAAAIAAAQADAAMLHVTATMRQLMTANPAPAGSPYQGYAQAEEAMAMVDRLLRGSGAGGGAGADRSGNTAGSREAEHAGGRQDGGIGPQRAGPRRQRSPASPHRKG